METVLVVGSTGHIGVAAVVAALRSKRNVLAIVRNQKSAEKIFQVAGTRDGITTVEVDVLSDQGVQDVVDQVKAGKLPAFQHVFTAVGGSYSGTPLTEITTEALRESMNINFESNFFAYRATMPYLLEQKNPASTWTICTGSQGDIGRRPAPGMTQGALFSMANAASRDNLETNVRFNEIYLACRVETDSVAVQSGAMKSSHFGLSYERLLSRKDIRSSRVKVSGPADLEDLKYESKIVSF